MRPTHPVLYAPDSGADLRVLTLVTIQWAGLTIRLADGTADIETADGEVLHYDEGLGDVSFTETLPLNGDASGQLSVPLEMLMPEEVNVPALVAQGHRLASARAELARWVEGTTWEERRPVLVGRFSEPQHGAAEDPVVGSLEEQIWKESAFLIPPTWRVSGFTWEHADTVPVEVLGTTYPIILGRPGNVSSAIDSDRWVTASPARWVLYDRLDTGGGTGNQIAQIAALVCYGHAEVSSVWVNTDDDTGGYRIRTMHTFDERGVPVTVLPWWEEANPDGAELDTYDAMAFTYSWSNGSVYGLGHNSLPTSFNGTTAKQLYVAWRDEDNPTAGGPLVGGKAVRSAGDVVLYLLGLTTRAVDRGRCAAFAPAVARFLIDAVIADATITPWGLLRDELLPILPISIVSGPEGLYFIPWRYDATPADATVFVDAGADPDIERLTPLTEETSDAANRFTLRFAYSYRTKSYAATITLGAEGDDTGDSVDGSVARFRTSPYCTASRKLTEATVDREIETALVYDEGTAWAILEWMAAVYALPRMTVRYRLPEATFLHIERGAVALLTDPEVYLEARVAVVQEVKTDGSGFLEVAFVMFERPGDLRAAA